MSAIAKMMTNIIGIIIIAVAAMMGILYYLKKKKEETPEQTIDVDKKT